MNIKTLTSEALPCVSAATQPPVKPLLAAIRIGGGSPLNPVAVQEYMEKQRKAHSSPSWHCWLSDRLPCSWCDRLYPKFGVEDAVILIAFLSLLCGLICAIAGIFWHTMFTIAGVSLAITVASVVATFALTWLGDAVYVRLRRAEWSSVPLGDFIFARLRYADPLFWEDSDGPVPQKLLKLVDRIRMEVPASFIVHYLETDPVLEVKGDDESYYLGVWDEHGIVSMPSI